MFETYCNYGLHDEYNGSCYEEGDKVDEIIYEGEKGTVILKDVMITTIRENKISIVTNDCDYITINVDSIHSVE